MMTSNVDRMEAAALARAGSEDLVKRLRCEADGAEFSSRYADLVGEAAYRIEQLEREFTAEKAMADQAAELISGNSVGSEWKRGCQAFLAAYRKARGL